MLSVEDWAEIRRLHRAEGLPIKVIARVLGVSKNTVKAALASDGPPKYERPPRVRWLMKSSRGSANCFRPIRGCRHGGRRADRLGPLHPCLSARVAELRPVYLPPDPASRTAYAAGEIAQCDLWFPDVAIPVGCGQTRTATRLAVLTMISAYSRWLIAILIPTRRAEDLFAGWWELIGRLGAVVRALVWDGEGAIGRWRGGRVELTKECQAFRGVLAAKVIVCKPAEPTRPHLTRWLATRRTCCPVAPTSRGSRRRASCTPSCGASTATRQPYGASSTLHRDGRSAARAQRPGGAQRALRPADSPDRQRRPSCPGRDPRRGRGRRRHRLTSSAESGLPGFRNLLVFDDDKVAPINLNRLVTAEAWSVLGR